MTELKIRMLGAKICNVSHDKSKSTIITTTPREYGGIIDDFSSTDLLSAALGTCIATTIEDLLLRNSIQLDNVEIIVQKELSKSPKGIKFIAVDILLHQGVDSKLLKMISKAAKTCLIHNSLVFDPKITVKEVNCKG